MNESRLHVERIIRSAEQEPHDALFDGLFPMVKRITDEVTSIADLLKAANYPSPPHPTAANGTKTVTYWENCQHHVGHTAMHILSPATKKFADPAARKMFLTPIPNYAYQAMNALDELRVQIGDLPVEGTLDIQKTTEHIHRAKNALRQLARYAERSVLGVSAPAGAAARGE